MNKLSLSISTLTLFIFFALIPLISHADNSFIAQTIGGIGIDSARSIIQTTDGGYAIAGYTGSFGQGGTDAHIIKFTSTGALDTSFGTSGTRTVGGTSYDEVYSIICVV